MTTGGPPRRIDLTGPLLTRPSVRIVNDVSAAMHSRDRVAHELDISIDSSAPGSATVSMTVTDQMTNGLGVCHGGIVFTLADTAMAHASNAGNGRTLATSASIEWIRAARIGDGLTAKCLVIARRGRNMVHDIEVTNGAGETVALVRGQTLTLSDAGSLPRSEGGELIRTTDSRTP